MKLVPVHTPEDLYRCWQALMGPLGFSRRSLWLAFIGADGQMNRGLHQIDEIPVRVDPQMCLPLMEMCSVVLADDAHNRSVAILLARPGRDPMNADDRSWARGLLAAAKQTGLPMQPVHFANDNTLLVFAADDLLPIG